MIRLRAWGACALAGLTLLAGCDMPSDSAARSSPFPAARPAMPEIEPKEVSGTLSLALVDYYSRLQAALLSRGLLRTDTGAQDAPYGPRDLVRNFLKIAFYEEYSDQGGTLVARESASRLHRWDKPIRLTVEFGGAVPAANKARDLAEVNRFARQLSRATGQSVTVGPGGNFFVYFVSEDERRALGPRLRQIMPGVSNTAVDTVVNLPRTTYCLAFATDPEQDGTYDQAVAVIRAEHPDLMRQSCIQEELAQGLGLSNDYPLARPSIFNDDEEFGLLTSHDEYLLKMLYDPRLRPGMTEAEARPIVEVIAGELLGGDV